MNTTGRQLIPLLITFAFIGILVLVLSATLNEYSIDTTVLHAGNLFFFLISLVSFFIQRRGLHNSNPHVFVRSVMTGMMLKMVLTVIAVFIYVYISGTTFNKRAVFLALFFYLIYLAVEVYVVMKMNKNKKVNA